MSKKLEQQIEELWKVVQELKGKQSKPEPIELPFWMPKERENYWWIKGCGELDFSSFSFGYFSERSSIGNYFETEELAQKHVDKLKLIEEIKQWRGKHDPGSFRLDWEDMDENKFELILQYPDREWNFAWCNYQRNFAGIYLSNREAGNKFLKDFGNRLDILLEGNS